MPSGSSMACSASPLSTRRRGQQFLRQDDAGRVADGGDLQLHGFAPGPAGDVITAVIPLPETTRRCTLPAHARLPGQTSQHPVRALHAAAERAAHQRATCTCASTARNRRCSCTCWMRLSGHDTAGFSQPHSDEEIFLNADSSTRNDALQVELPPVVTRSYAFDQRPVVALVSIPSFDPALFATARKELLPPPLARNSFVQRGKMESTPATTCRPLIEVQAPGKACECGEAAVDSARSIQQVQLHRLQSLMALVKLRWRGRQCRLARRMGGQCTATAVAFPETVAGRHRIRPASSCRTAGPPARGRCACHRHPARARSASAEVMRVMRGARTGGVAAVICRAPWPRPRRRLPACA